MEACLDRGDLGRWESERERPEGGEGERDRAVVAMPTGPLSSLQSGMNQLRGEGRRADEEGSPPSQSTDSFSLPTTLAVAALRTPLSLSALELST